MRQFKHLPTILLALLIGIIALLSITRLVSYETVTYAESNPQSRAQGKPTLVYPKIGHTDSVTCIAYSPDMRMLASGSADRTIKLWLADAGIPVKTLIGHKGSVESIAFSPNGRLIVSGGADKTIILWDAVHGTLLRSLISHEGTVLSVAFSPDGEIIASSGGDKMVRLWNTVTGNQQTFAGHTAPVFSVAFSPDGKVIASGSSDQTAILWDAATGTQLRPLAGHKDTVSSVAFSPDGKTVATGSWDQSIKLWDVKTGKELITLTWHQSVISSIAFSPDGKLLASGSEDKTIKLWNVATGEEVRTLKDHSRGVTSVIFNPNGKSIASSSKDKRINIWSVFDGSLQKTLQGHAYAVSSVAYSPNGIVLAAGSYDNTIKIWDLKRGVLVRSLAGHTNTITSVAFSPSGRTLASGSADNTVKLWDVATGAELTTLKGHSKSVTSVVFNVDEQTIASASGDRTIRLWETATGRQLRTLIGHDASVSAIAFSPDGKILASGSWDKTIKLWDPVAGQELRRVTGHSGEVYSVAFSLDGKILASGSADNTIKLWDPATGQELRALAKHSAGVTSVAFSADRKILASGSRDKTVMLWNVTNGEEISTLKGHSEAVRSVAFSVDGRQLASAATDATIKLWSAGNARDLATLIAVDDKDWIVVDNQERFDSSPRAGRLLYWSVGNELIALDQLEERYYEPGLLSKALGFSTEGIRNVSNAPVKLLPDVKFEPPVGDSNKLIINLTNRGGGIGKVQVFVNDKELIADARPSGFNPDQKEAVLTVNLSTSWAIPGQDNEIRVVAQNRDGLSDLGTKVAWRPKGTIDATPPSFYAIVVGTSTYASPALELRYAAKSAGDMAKALELGGKGLFGAQMVHVDLLSSDKTNPRAIAPTKANIRKAFELARKAKPQDVFVVYFAGYGVRLQGKDSYLYLTQDARTAESPALADAALREQTTISSDELLDWISGVSALKKAMILDTSAAAAAMGKLVKNRNTQTGGIFSDQIRAIEQLKDRAGLHMLLGSTADEVSYEASQYGQSLLTYALLQGMRGAALRANEYVDVQTLFQYAADVVPQLARNIGGIQRPLMAIPLGSSFDIGRIPVNDRAAIPLAIQKPLVLRPVFINATTTYDDLDITPSVIQGLKNESKEGRIVFVNADEMYSAIRAEGSYTVSGPKVKLRLRFITNNVVLSMVNVEGITTNLKRFGALVTETIIQEVTNDLTFSKAESKKKSKHHADRRRLRAGGKFRRTQTSERVTFIPYDFHNVKPNAARVDLPSTLVDLPSTLVVVRPVIRNSRAELGDDLGLQEEVVKGLKTWSANTNDSVLIEFRDVDELQGAYKFEGVYERNARGFLRLSLTLKLNGAVMAETTPTVSDSSNKTLLADLFIEMARIAISSLSTDRGTRVVGTDADLKVLNYPLRSYALFIATNDYDDDSGWQDLSNPICDAEAIKRELVQHYGYDEQEDIVTAYNQDYKGVSEAIDSYHSKVLPADSDTALFIFIAGHGTYDPQRKRGMLATRNAKIGNERGDNYYRFSSLLEDITALPFAHIFVVIDACQSGDAINDSTDRGNADERSDAEFLVDKLKDRKTRKAFTSASYNNVPDGPRGGHSPFAEKLLEAFRTYGSNDRFLTLNEIWTLGGMDRLRTTPRQGWFKDNVPGSDFLFIARPKVKEYRCPTECNCN